MLEIDKGLGRHDGHLHLQCVLQVIAGAIGSMTGRTRSNDAQRAKGCGLEKIDELAYKFERTLEVLTHTLMGKLNVIEHFHRLTSYKSLVFDINHSYKLRLFDTYLLTNLFLSANGRFWTM